VKPAAHCWTDDSRYSSHAVRVRSAVIVAVVAESHGLLILVSAGRPRTR
jgi:hypothetical protein